MSSRSLPNAARLFPIAIAVTPQSGGTRLRQARVAARAGSDAPFPPNPGDR